MIKWALAQYPLKSVHMKISHLGSTVTFLKSFVQFGKARGPSCSSSILHLTFEAVACLHRNNFILGEKKFLYLKQ